jgi:proteasome lid subunit RPN8/RPN11
MTFSIRKIIRAFAAPEHRLSCSSRLWRDGFEELRRRTEGTHESGAFLLGDRDSERRRITRFVYYDDLDPHSLETGIVVFDGAGYGPLWQICRETGLTVVADVHVHGGLPYQSQSDRENPMIALPGHIALIVPDFAERLVGADELGIYEYKGEHQWTAHIGKGAYKFFYVGFWG